MKGSLRFIIPLAIFLVLVGFLAAGLKLDPRAVPSPLIGKPAPGFALPRLDDPNTTIQRDTMLGKAWVLNVWASWCGPCRDEHPHIVAFAKTRQAPVIGLNYKDKRDDARAWLKQLGDPYDAVAVGPRRPRRHQLRRVWRARDLRDRQAGRDPLQARRDR